MDRYKIKNGQNIKLQDWDPNETSLFDGGKRDAKERISELNEELEALQELLFAEHKQKVLIVLQGMDTSGKDGTIRHVFEGVNPQGVRVASFKRPTPKELAHDYLWRVHRQVPGKGEITIFNRSHYEDVLVVRVHQLVPEEVWGARYSQINDFERMLFEEGTTIRKFYLHINMVEQKERLQARLDTPSKQWKFNTNDLKERKLWDQYIKSYEDVLNRTSTEWAPWYIVPANHKWYRNLVVANILVQTLKDLKMSFPAAEEDLSGIIIE
jgi:PPK2 family polyphosphate:nucleotide phosphotransferase